MNWQDYVGLAIRTESVPNNMFGAIEVPNGNFDMEEERQMAAKYNKATRLLHAALGVCTETAELHDGHTIVNWVEEIGDILWYLAIADSTINWHEEHYHADLSKPSLFYIGEVQDVLKRHIFYGAEVNVERLGRAFSAILEHCAEELASKSFKLEEAMVANIIKLEKRYPDKFFDAKAAIHRDVDRELEHISETGEVMIVGATPAMVTVDEHEPMVGEVEVKPYTLELGDSEDAQLAEVVKQRQGQSTISVDIDELLDAATVESDTLLRWEHLTTEGIELHNLITEEVDDMFVRPGAVKSRILAWLGCSAEQAVALIGESFTHSESRIHAMGDGKFHLKVFPYEQVEEVMDKETIMETFFPLNQVQLSFQGFNTVVQTILSKEQVEKMAMDLAFVRADQYRKMGALELARGYDAMYRSYSSKGDRLDDYSLAIMWQEAGCSMDEGKVKELLERWK